MIYLDHAATTALSRTALDAMLPYMNETYGNPSSLHSAGQRAAEAIEQARATIARLIGGQAREITFTSGGSEADNQAILSAAAIGEKKGKKHLVSTAIEHHAVLHTLRALEKRGFEVTLVPVPENGIVKPDEIARAIRPDTALVSVMYANNEIGTIQPVASIASICHARGVLFHTDAVQAIGQLDVNVVRDGVDFLSLSAHKFHGPKGVGALYARRGLPLISLIEGGAQERGKRAGTENVPAIVGMAAAMEEAVLGREENAARMTALRDRLIEGLGRIPHSILNGDGEKRLPGNVSFCFEGIEGESLLLLLDDKGICASSGSACTSGSLDPSHVLLAIGRVHEIAHGSLRLTLSAENTPEQIEKTIEAVTDVVSYLRSISPVWRDLVSGKTPHVIP